MAAGVGVRALAMGSSGARGGLAAEVAEAQQEAEAARASNEETGQDVGVNAHGVASPARGREHDVWSLQLHHTS